MCVTIRTRSFRKQQGRSATTSRPFPQDAHATVAQRPPYSPEHEVAWRLFLEFTDQAHLHWRRGPSGELTQTVDTPFDREDADKLPTTYSDVRIFRVGHIA